MLDIRYPNGAKTDEEKIVSIVTNISKLDDALAIYLLSYFGNDMSYEIRNKFRDNFIAKLDFIDKVKIVKDILDSVKFESIRSDFRKNAQRLAEIRNVVCHEPKFILNDKSYDIISNFEWPKELEKQFSNIKDREKSIETLYNEFVDTMEFFKDFMSLIFSGEKF